MKIYIPFNSNDFNSVFSTLSISPRKHYALRKYSYERATETKLNPFEHILIGYTRPVFVKSKFDKDDGYPVNLEVDIKPGTELKHSIEDISAYAIEQSLFLFGTFSLWFRTKNELDETIARTHRSLETKYAEYALKQTNVIGKDGAKFLSVDDILSFQKPEIRLPADFKSERKLNKVMGAILGFSVGYKSQISPELLALKRLVKDLNNLSSLYFQHVTEIDAKDYKLRVIDCLKKIRSHFEDDESLEESINEISTDTEAIKLEDLRIPKISGISYFDLIIEGLISKSYSTGVTLPPLVLIQKIIRTISGRFYKKSPQQYIEKVEACIKELKLKINNRIDDRISTNSLEKDYILSYKNSEVFEIKGIKSSQSSNYLKEAISFLVEYDYLKSPDDLQASRKQFVGEIGSHFKNNIGEFEKTRERDYLLSLLKSFDSLRAKFDVESVDNDVVKCLAILCTSGRDLQKYLDTIEQYKIEHLSIAYSIWGAAFGHSSLPKTLTDSITKESTDLDILMSLFDEVGAENYLGQLESTTSVIEEPEMDYGDIEVEKMENVHALTDEPEKQETNELKIKKDTFLKKLSKQKFGKADKKEVLEMAEKVFDNMIKSGLDNEEREFKLMFFNNMINSKEFKIQGLGKKGIESVSKIYESVQED